MRPAVAGLLVAGVALPLALGLSLPTARSGEAAPVPLASTAGEPAAQPGVVADSARVVRFLDALGAADPLVCEMVADPIGNFWWSSGHNYGVGQVADTRLQLRALKDSLSRRVSDPAAIRVLATRLGAEDPCVRQVAAKLLGGSTATDEALGRLLDHDSPRVREAALRAIGTRERPALRARVERLLGAREVPVIAMAAWTLGEMEQRQSVPALRRALAHDAPAVRMAAARALGDIEDPAAAGDLERLVARDADRRVRHLAIEALGSLEQPGSLTVLSAVLAQGDVELAIAAAHAIGDLDEMQAAPPALVRAVDSPHPALRRAALEALVNFDDPAIEPKLIPFVRDEDAEVRTMVIEALGNLGSRASIPALKRALNDPVAEVRRAAIEALAEIDDR